LDPLPCTHLETELSAGPKHPLALFPPPGLKLLVPGARGPGVGVGN